MFKTLIIKEIQESFVTIKSMIAIVLSITLIPFSIYVSKKEFIIKQKDYIDSQQSYIEKSKGAISEDFQAKGFIPPSQLSIFSMGLVNEFPDCIITQRDDMFHYYKKWNIDSPISSLLGEIDLQFCVVYILSLFALIFIYDTISGEKERQTLKLILSNPVPKWQILVAKLLGNYITFIIPVLIGFIFGFIILAIGSEIQVYTKQFIVASIFVLLCTLVFLFTMFCLGLLISCNTKKSAISIIVLLIIWCFLTFIIPQSCPMIAQLVYPIKSLSLVDAEKSMIKKNLSLELDHHREEILSKLMSIYQINANNMPFLDKNWAKVQDEYVKEIKPLDQEYSQKIKSRLNKIDTKYFNERNRQKQFALSLALISPVTAYKVMVSELSRTGYGELINIQNNAIRFQEEVNNLIYKKFYLSKSIAGGSVISIYVPENDDAKIDKTKVPIINYVHQNNDVIFLENIFVFFIILLSGIILFVLCFVSFIRYDFR
jgi:ABC-2 type transport system permease protein